MKVTEEEVDAAERAWVLAWGAGAFGATTVNPMRVAIKAFLAARESRQKRERQEATKRRAR